MSGTVAAAKAFFDAGNRARARTEIEKVLAAQPEDPAALDLLCDILRDAGDWESLETTAKAWLAKDARATPAYFNLLMFNHHKRRRREAKRLKALYEGALSNPADVAMLNQFYDLFFVDTVGALKRMSELAAASGDQPASFSYASKAASLRSDINKAFHNAELALQAGDDSAANLEKLSVLSLRLMRFSRCREYARLTLQKEPTRALPRELIVLSWLAYLPPFMLASVASYAVSWMDRFDLAVTLWAYQVFWGIFLLPAGLFLYVLAKLTFVPVWVLIALALAYFFYLRYMLGTASRWLNRRAGKAVKLKDY